MGALLTRATSGEALLRAWNEVRDNAYADGDPGAPVLAFESRALKSLSELADALADGTYQPRALTRVTIPKPVGGFRDLAVGAVDDRVLERAVLEVLDPLVDPVLSPWSFAYRRGLGVRDAVRAMTEARESGARWVVRTDFDDCFDSIPRWAVLKRLAEVVPDTELVALVQRLVGRPVIGQPRSNGLGLHQGSGLSPALSNLYLDTFDRRMMKLGHQVIRYGDDIAIPVSDRPTGDRVLELASVEAAAIRLRLESTKSQVVSYDEGVPFCGQIITATTGPSSDPQSSPLQGTIFVTTEGALLRAKGERVRVEKADELLANVNFRRVRQIVCVGRVGVTSALLHHVAERGIDLAWLYDDGRYAARLTTLSCGGDPELRLAQYQAALDERRRLQIARQFVAGKITNMRVGLLRAARSQEQPALADHQPRLFAARSTALAATNIAELMGCEGAATRDYFDGLSRVLGSEWGFTARQRRPPPDPVNSMLSFGYTLLFNEAVTACVLAGLDPYLGMLHSPHRNRPSLALDLIEEVRPVVVDATVVRLVRTSQVTPASFTLTAEHGCRLDPASRRAFLEAFERRMLTLVHHPGEGRRISWRHALVAQARQLAAVLLERQSEYRPVIWR
jgi:CRISP-associated protein Cas1